MAPLLLCVVIAGGGATCSAASHDAPSPSAREVPADTLLATVDTVQAPARLATADTLRLRLRGMVGPNGCYSLVRVEEERSPGRVVLRPIVRHSGQDMCTMAIVSLDETITLDPPFREGAFQVVVPQTDRATVRTTVRVGAGTTDG
jgi:hypothetical protein